MQGPRCRWISSLNGKWRCTFQGCPVQFFVELCVSLICNYTMAIEWLSRADIQLDEVMIMSSCFERALPMLWVLKLRNHCRWHISRAQVRPFPLITAKYLTMTLLFTSPPPTCQLHSLPAAWLFQTLMQICRLSLIALKRPKIMIKPVWAYTQDVWSAAFAILAYVYCLWYN